MLLEFFLDPDASEESKKVLFDKQAPLLRMPCRGAALPARLDERFGSAKTELPPMEELFETLKNHSPELRSILRLAAANQDSKKEQEKKKRVIFSRRRLFKEVWLKGNVSQFWESTFTSSMRGTKKTTAEGVDILFVDVDRKEHASVAPPEASGYLFEQLCIEEPCPYGFFTLVSYDVGDYILLMSGEVDCAAAGGKGEGGGIREYVELKMTSSHPRYFTPLPEEERRRFWVVMELGGYGKVIRAHRDKFKHIVDMIAVEEYPALSSQLRRPDTRVLQEILLKRVERMWHLFDHATQVGFQAKDLI